MLARLVWVLFLRLSLRYKIKGFSASIGSFVSNSTFKGNNKLNGRSIVRDSSLGRHTYLNSAVISNVEMGAFCSVGANSMIGGLGKHPVNRISTHPAFYSNKKQSGKFFYYDNSFVETEKTYIGNDVWIGANVITIDGIRIGNGAVIAAGAVVIRDVPDYSVVGGVPAKILKMRFSEEEILMLNSMCWWDYSDEALSEITEYFLNNNVRELFAKLGKK